MKENRPDKRGLIQKIHDRKTILLVLSCFAVFITAYALILPASTLDQKTAEAQGGIDIAAQTEDPGQTGTETKSKEDPQAKDDAQTKEDLKAKDDAESDKDVQEKDSTTPEKDPQADLKKSGDQEKAPAKEDKTESSKAGSSEKAPATLSADGKGYSVSAVYDNAAKLPDETKLTVKEIKSSDKDYEALQKLALKTLRDGEKKNGSTGLKFSRFYDISLVAGGSEQEPAAPVDVTISYDKALPIADRSNVRIIHFTENKKGGALKAELLDQDDVKLKVKNDKMSQAAFETKAFSVFGLVETTIEKNVLTSDGQNYKVSVTCGPDAGIPEDAELSVEEITTGASGYDAYVADTEVALDMKKGSADYIRLFDIKIVDADGKKIQPAKGSTVDVRVELADSESEDLSVVHFADGAKAGDVVAAKTDGQAVNFEADGFSVYAVVDGSTDENARMTVEFYSKGTKIATMYVKNGDTEDELEEILYDPGAGVLQSGESFTGWILDNPDYTSEDLDDTMNISDVRAWAEALDITEGYVHRFDAAICKLYTITYKDLDGTVLGMDSIPVKAGEYGTAGIGYTVNMAYTPKDDIHKFEGWTIDEDARPHVASDIPEGGIYQNGDPITIKGDVSFTVNAPEGAWLIFDENGKGAKYNAPQFVKADEVTQRPCSDADMVRNGYTFGGWYDTKEHADAHAQNPSVTTGRFTFGSELESKTTIYASWIPNTRAPYTVIFWGQNDSRDGYEVLGSYSGTNGVVGQDIPYTFVNNGDEDYVTGVGNNNGHYTGFCLTEGSRNQHVTITPEGDAVLNLYYDRILYHFKFYLYRNGSQNNRYDYANNSGSGSTLNDLVTWHSNQTAHPSVTGRQIQSETYGGRTYYYFVMDAYYGEDISSKWPKYDEITGANGREAVSFVMMVGTKLKPNPTNQGSGTVKGIITVMDENILGATNDASGNYVMIRFPDSYYNWRYHIWFETIEGEDYSGKTTHTWNGKTYYEDTIITVRSSNTTVTNQNAPKYEGFDFVDWRSQNWNNRNYWTTGNNPTLYHINQVYDRQKFKISYFDGSYVDGSGNPIQNKASNLLHESGSIPHGKQISTEDREYVPDAPEEGYVFAGWYIDEACTVEYTWGTMPIGGIIVYAKWIQEEYRVFLHPNAGTDENLDWGSENVSTSFRVSYGEKVSTPTGTREGSGYEFVGWYTDPSLGSQYLYNPDTEANNTTVTTPYDKTEDTELNKWGNVIPGQEGVNKDTDRFWISKKLDLYAKWRKILEDADGITVTYTADDGKGHVGSNAPEDASVYPDQARATAQAADTAPDGMYFSHWVIQKWDEDANEGAGGYVDTELTVLPGQEFTIDEAYARKQPDPDNPGKYTYTMQLRAEYGEPEGELPTHIWWFHNYSDTGAARHDSSHQDEGIQINEGIDIQPVPTREGYTFLGWARVPTGTSASQAGTGGDPPTAKVLELDADDLYLKYENDQYKLNDSSSDYNGAVVTQVAADERLQYHDMYAVWEVNTYTVTLKKIVENGTAEDNQHGFVINYDFDDTSLTDGSVTLKHNQTKALSSIKVPYGTVITVSETEEGFDPSYSAERTTDASGAAVSPPEEVDPVANTDDSFKVTGDTTVTVTNTPHKIPIKAVKTDQEGEPLAGVTFRGDLIPGGSVTTAITGQGTDAEAVIFEDNSVLAGTYTIRETAVPAGYYMLEGEVTINVENGDSGGMNVTAEVKNDTRSSVSVALVDTFHPEKGYIITIKNDAGVVLPESGGSGTVWIYLLGSILLLGCGTILVARRRIRA